MKLVEILARELKEWPETKEYARQDFDMEICFSRGSVSDDTTTKFDFMPSRFASDNRLDSDQACGTLYVTRAQWEAERARLAAMDGNQSTLDYFINNFEVKDGRAYHKETGYVWVPEMSSELGKEAEDWRAEAKKQYEQELWDRVAEQLIVKFSSLGSSKSWNSSNCMEAMEVADAFMAERDKRLKGVK